VQGAKAFYNKWVPERQGAYLSAGSDAV
jgi:hypothetical protein